MLGALIEFAVLFGIAAVVLLVLGVQRGWFIDVAHTASQPTSEIEDLAAERRSRMTPSDGRTPADQRTSVGQPAATAPDAPLDRQGAHVHFASSARANDIGTVGGRPDPTASTTSASAIGGVKTAERMLPGHWAVETIQARPGWMLFDVSDFLGAPEATVTYRTPRGPREARLYAAEAVRRAERENTLIAISRRKVIKARWEKRRAKRLGPDPVAPRPPLARLSDRLG
ncbi:MAG: hypothetical protein ACFCUN_09165 [Hyphomicrobiaceae bacterium]